MGLTLSVPPGFSRWIIGVDRVGLLGKSSTGLGSSDREGTKGRSNS